MKSCFSAGTGN